MNFPTEFSEETKREVALWRDIILERHRNDDDQIFCNDPLLIIEYNQAGLTSRNITKDDVVAGIIINIILYNLFQKSFSNFIFWISY